MAAKGKKKNKSKSKDKKVVKNVPEKEEEEEKDFDLETMEKMLAEDEHDDKDENNLDDDFKENEEEQEEEEDDKSSDENDEKEEIDNDDESSDETMEDSAEEETEDSIQNEATNEIGQGEEKCSTDLRNLLAINSHQVNHRSLYKKKSGVYDDNATLCTSGMMKANDNYLLQKASEGCLQLLEGLWSLETEKSDAGPLATLPTYAQTITPRELPPPQLKAETKWEKFAKERGIAPKEKRSRKVWDEAEQKWGYRTGYQKASTENDPQSWPIMEVRRNDDPFEDPWQRARDAKKERVEKNTMNRMRNAEKEGTLDRGTTRRVIKGKVQEREKGRLGGNKDMKNFTHTPAGVPLDLADGKQRGKNLTKAALLATQTSTASLGKFDKMREGEPERRKSMSGLKKRKFESATAAGTVKFEAKKSMKVLENVISGGGKSKERAIRRGHFAKGETGHDFDFNDGLGPGTFKKKKGRAGMGKMKKITKKLAR